MISKTPAITAAFFALGVSGASATDYCWAERVSLCNGCSTTLSWKVTNANVPRVLIPGNDKTRKTCVVNWRSLGGNQQMKILTPPKYGKATIRSYSVLFTSTRSGRDTFVVENSWLSPTGETWRGTVTYVVDVIDDPV